MTEKEQKWALFWCGLLREMIFEEIDAKEIGKALKEIASKEYVFPDGKKKKPSISTLWRKWKKYQESGFNSLVRQKRNDKNKVRVVDEHIIEKAVQLKKEQPKRSDEAINKFLEAEFGKKLCRSTLYYHLKKHGATQTKLGITKTKVRKRWSKDSSNIMWVGDFQHGPYVIDEGVSKQTYLSLFIDCYSRYVVEGKYYFRENLDILIDTLLRAWGTHGCSHELYLDNAKVYHATALKSACYQLQINLKHRPIRQPESGGIVERMFLTSQTQFESEVKAGTILTLEQLNTAFLAWLNESYHKRIHSETKETPEERYRKGIQAIRRVSIDKIIPFFMKKETRVVDTTFSDIRLHNHFYRVDPRLRGDKVMVHFDSFGDKTKVFLYALDDSYLGEGKLYQREYGEPMKPIESKKPQNNYLDLLTSQHQKSLAQDNVVSYQELITPKKWSFQQFVQSFARLLGRKGGNSAFTQDESLVLQSIFNHHEHLDEAMLVQASMNASEKTIPLIALQLQLL